MARLVGQVQFEILKNVPVQIHANLYQLTLAVSSVFGSPNVFDEKCPKVQKSSWISGNLHNPSSEAFRYLESFKVFE